MILMRAEEMGVVVRPLVSRATSVSWSDVGHQFYHRAIRAADLFNSRLYEMLFCYLRSMQCCIPSKRDVLVTTFEGVAVGIIRHLPNPH